MAVDQMQYVYYAKVWQCADQSEENAKQIIPIKDHTSDGYEPPPNCTMDHLHPLFNYKHTKGTGANAPGVFELVFSYQDAYDLLDKAHIGARAANKVNIMVFTYEKPTFGPKANTWQAVRQECGIATQVPENGGPTLVPGMHHGESGVTVTLQLSGFTTFDIQNSRASDPIHVKGALHVPPGWALAQGVIAC